MLVHYTLLTEYILMSEKQTIDQFVKSFQILRK